MKQQTAVEWLIKEIQNKNGIEFISYCNELISQAKEIESVQILDSYRAGEYDGIMQGLNNKRIYIDEFDYLTKQKENGKKV